MRFVLKNVGPISNLSIDLGGLTVVCGPNNNGKTYLSYILYSLLSTIQANIKMPIKEQHIKQLLECGEVQIDLLDYAKSYVNVIKDAVPCFVATLPRFMAMHPDKFRKTKMDIILQEKEVKGGIVQKLVNDSDVVGGEVEISRTAKLEFRFMRRSTVMKVSLANKFGMLPSNELIEKALSFLLAHLTNFSAETPFFPDVFVVTCERTGVALFTKELLDVRERESSYIDDVEPEKFGSVGYQLPVEKEILFIRNLKKIIQGKSFIAKYHPEILQAFARISGGQYELDDETSAIRYFLKGNRRAGLALAESSSAVRSLSELYFYLKHCAREGQLLMIDEPELNLHPENQRRIARVLCMLVKAGIRVFVTTHSDYIVRELNTMVRAAAIVKAQDLGRHRRGASCGLHESCLLEHANVRMFVLRDGRIFPVRYSDCAKGFAVSSFDKTIKAFNGLYEKVLKCELQANEVDYVTE